MVGNVQKRLMSYDRELEPNPNEGMWASDSLEPSHRLGRIAGYDRQEIAVGTHENQGQAVGDPSPVNEIS